jgi:hypothetical protein
MSSGIFLVGLLLLWVLALFAFASCSVPSFRKPSFFQSPTQTEREERSSSSDSSHGLQAKTQSRFQVGTWRIWGKQPLWESSAFISGHHLVDDD